MSGHELPQTNQELIGQIKIPVEDLVQLDASAQSNAMRAWFLDNYEDPVHSLPYSSQEGGYIWLDGGPYDPHDELHAKFGEFVPEAVIQELGDELFAECHEWAAQVDLSDDDVYGFEYIAEATSRDCLARPTAGCSGPFAAKPAPSTDVRVSPSP